MGIDRREFLKITGLSALMGLGGRAVFELLTPGEAAAVIKSAPLPQAKRWGFVVDTNKMTPEIMDKCIEACHRLHNVPNWGDPRVEVKWIWKETYEHTFPGQGHLYQDERYKNKGFLLFCNHCDNPPCCRVCPTKATWKREDGVVMMDQHRCIGCRFCMAACPFGARSFNWGDSRKAPMGLNPDFPTNLGYPTRTKGVVEKCTLCDERLANGQLPACVEAANEMEKGAMLAGDLLDPGSDVRRLLESRYAIRRKPELGTGPNIYYIL